MTTDEKQEFKQVIKEGSIEALKSKEGQQAVVDAFKSEEAKDLFTEYFVEAFHDVVVPTIYSLHEKHEERIHTLEVKTGIIN